MCLRILFLLPEGAAVAVDPSVAAASGWVLEAVDPVRVSICSWMATSTTFTLTMAVSMEVTAAAMDAFSVVVQVTVAVEIFLAMVVIFVL